MPNINVLGHFLLRRPLKSIFDKTWLDNNMAHPLKKFQFFNIRITCVLSRCDFANFLSFQSFRKCVT